jgi:TetR/AcrR family transcriptional repressor of nem operon
MKAKTNENYQQILTAGYQLIAVKGFSHVGLSEILKTANVPKGSFYYYFKSKEHFGEELINDYFSEYLLSIDTLFTNSELTGYGRLMEYWQRWSDTQSTPCNDKKCLVVKLGAEVADLSEAMRIALQNGANHVIDKISACIDVGVNDGSINPNIQPHMAESLYHLWLGASIVAKLQKDEKPLSSALVTTKLILGTNASNESILN